jgi:hypothetical protein
MWIRGCVQCRGRDRESLRRGRWCVEVELTYFSWAYIRCFYWAATGAAARVAPDADLPLHVGFVIGSRRRLGLSLSNRIPLDQDSSIFGVFDLSNPIPLSIEPKFSQVDQRKRGRRSRNRVPPSPNSWEADRRDRLSTPYVVKASRIEIDG